MTPARSLGQATRDSAVMAVCIVLVIACTGFASQGWALLISFDGRPSDTAQSGLLTMAIVAAALAVIAVIAGLIGHSWWSAGIIGAHAALTVLHPNLRLLSALPVIVALLLLARARLVAPALLGRVDNARR